MTVRVKAGQFLIKVWNTVSLQTPFGVHKNNEYGRKKGIEAIHHYSHLRTITVRMQHGASLLHIDMLVEYSLVIIQPQKSAQCLFIAFADQVILVVPN